MRLGVSLNSTHAVEHHPDGARRIIERARVARDAGLDSLSLGDHHSMGTPYYQGVPMLGRLSAEWPSDRRLGCLFLLPLWHPVLVAELVGTLAAIHDGPFVVQTGIGGGDDQFAAMGADLSSRGVALDESIRVIKELLAGETVDSEPFGIAGAVVNPRPVQPVEWWVGAGAAAPLRRAAREGDCWYAGPGADLAATAASLDLYRAEASRLGRPSSCAMRQDVLILRDGDRARRIGREMIEAGYRGMTLDGVVVGSVDDAIEQLRGYDELDVDEIVVRCMASDQADAIETLELCGEVRAAFTD